MRDQDPSVRSARPPLWREVRLGLEAAALLRDPILRGQGMNAGRGRPVLLVPGFLAGDGSLSVMANWLRRAGYKPRGAGIVSNVDCSAAALRRIEPRLEQLVERHGRRAAIVGQSRGGSLARVLAHRRPDLVRGIVTLGSPLADPLAVHPLVRLQLHGVATLGALGAPRLFKRSCLDGACCADFWTDLAAALPDGIGSVSIYSRSDGIVDWHACIDPAADANVEIAASHCGMAVSPAAYRAVADALEGFEHAEPRRRPRASRTLRAA
jgi:pimeloyl-ACP methyl ester carboxylesterase